MIRHYAPMPDFAANYPDTAKTIKQLGLTFYCINCLRKTETTFLTPNFGPVCRQCVKELDS